MIVVPQLGVADLEPVLQAPALSHQPEQGIWSGVQADDPLLLRSRPGCSRQASAKPYATAKAADDSVTWAMNAGPPPLVGSIELQRVLPSQIN